jgi:hypothetical protein
VLNVTVNGTQLINQFFKELKMKARIIFVCVAIMAILAHADELQDLLGKKLVEYQGVCRLDANGMLVFDDKQAKTAPQCIVGADVGEKDLKAVLLFDSKGQPIKLLEYSLKDRKQRTLWVRGAT